MDTERKYLGSTVRQWRNAGIATVVILVVATPFAIARHPEDDAKVVTSSTTSTTWSKQARNSFCIEFPDSCAEEPREWEPGPGSW